MLLTKADVSAVHDILYADANAIVPANGESRSDIEVQARRISARVEPLCSKFSRRSAWQRSDANAKNLILRTIFDAGRQEKEYHLRHSDMSAFPPAACL